MHSQLEQYLTEVAKGLGPLPAARRDEEIREMRQHLQNAVTLYQGHGQSEDEAAKSAVAQFGSPDDLGQNIIQTWRRGKAIRRRDIAKSAVCAVFLSLLLPRILSPMTRPFALQAFNAHEFLIMTMLFALPLLLVGIINGFVLPRRAIEGTGLGIGIWVLYFLVATLFRPLNIQVAPGTHPSSFLFILIGMLNIGSFLVNWGLAALAAILGAWVGSRGRGSQVRLTATR